MQIQGLQRLHTEVPVHNHPDILVRVAHVGRIIQRVDPEGKEAGIIPTLKPYLILGGPDLLGEDLLLLAYLLESFYSVGIDLIMSY